MNKETNKESSKPTKRKIIVFILFLFLYFFLPKPVYMCMDGCSFMFFPPPGQLYEILSATEGMETLFYLIMLPIFSIFSRVLVLQIAFIYLCYKFSQTVVIYLQKRKLPSQKYYLLLIIGSLFVSFCLVLEIFSAINIYKEKAIYRKIESQELNNIDDIKKVVEQCESLEYNENCFSRISNKITEIELCRDIFPKYLYYLEDKCVYRIVVEKGDPTLCNKYVSFSEHMYQHPDCITDIAVKNKDPEICKLHDEYKYKGHLNYERIMQNCIKGTTK